jgi:pimeloyl-ACP methyl ester carboxylesterase
MAELEVLSRLPEQSNEKSPLLFVHGAWHGAWCWDEHFMPYFADLGYSTYAISLRAHGKSPGRLRWASLSDYVADVAKVAASLPSPPILIGHSMGGGVVQKYLESHDAPAALLLASMPPSGVIGFTLKFARTYPLRFLKVISTLSLFPVVETCGLAREFFFSDELPADLVTFYAGQLKDESFRAFLDILALNLPKPNRVRTPVLVLGAERDTIFPPTAVHATATAYRTSATMLPGLAHDMMLDARWRDAADAIAGLLDDGNRAVRRKPLDQASEAPRRLWRLARRTD